MDNPLWISSCRWLHQARGECTLGKPLRVAAGQLHPVGDLFRFPLKFGCGQRLYEDHVAERPRPHPKEAFFEGRWPLRRAGLVLGFGEPVRDRVDRAPCRELLHEAGELAGFELLGSGVGGEGEERFVFGCRAHDRVTGGKQLHRAALAVPDPAKGDRLRGGGWLARGRYRVVGRHERGHPLSPAVVGDVVPVLRGIPARDFGDPVSAKRAERVPA